jgi:predicted metal-dependent phosphoesterase TrpH
VIRVELHAHTSDDRHDRLPHSARDLIVHAAALGYGGIAITLHDIAYDPTPLADVARAHGIRVLAGIERTLGTVHVLLINYPAEAMLGVTRLDDLAGLKAAYPQGLVIAPHPFFPIASALGRERLDAYRNIWDALEINAMHVRGLDWNREAMRWAGANGVPLVGNGDVHRLAQLGRTWSEVDVDVPESLDDATAADRICEAIRAGRVRVVGAPLSPWRAGAFFVQMSISGLRGRLRI